MENTGGKCREEWESLAEQTHLLDLAYRKFEEELVETVIAALLSCD